MHSKIVLNSLNTSFALFSNISHNFNATASFHALILFQFFGNSSLTNALQAVVLPNESINDPNSVSLEIR